MNKEIKMIELIDMYVEDVVQPKKVKFDGNVYIYNGNSVLQQIINEYKGKIVFLLNEKVEIIEEDKDIEEIEQIMTSKGTYTNFDVVYKDMTKVYETVDEIIIKLNKIIKEVNKLRKENE